ncbi:helix-turn-helix transcriptional regulator [Microbacterium sp.]|uniref:helix-turn-helix transcriptional regulator n=1 Tax=Microbacterium sp. TaxID=51671 RepID=UPI002E369D45|nr:LuxR C-terminal-related transcriptional regulator [Microbacterium sp.]HEX5729158.1 LuxR C-terminal-related transcriptional regulator [Microbacterium sp.]
MTAALELARVAYQEHRWTAARDAFGDAQRSRPLPARDLELAATTAFLLGLESEGVDTLTRAHEAFLAADDITGAARCAAWLGIQLTNSGSRARGGGWLARAQRLVHGPGEPGDAEGFLLIPLGLGSLYSGDADGALRAFDQLVDFAQRFGDRDILCLARLGQGQARVMAGQVEEGMSLFDEAMVAVTADEISPLPAGIVYCAVIGTCHLAYDLRRAHEWTVALDQWCAARPDMIPFSAQCQAYRAALYCLHGAWSEAYGAALLAEERFERGDREAAYGAFYQKGEIERLRGQFEAAEASYRRAGETGFEPQPGLALLFLARGHGEVALALIRGAVDGTDPGTRRRLLPALVAIELAAGHLADARAAADELRIGSSDSRMPMLRASAGQAHAAVLLEEGDAHGALAEARRASSLWRDLDVPFELAQCRSLIARAHRVLEDAASADVEFQAARAIFTQLGATPSVRELDVAGRTPGDAPLTGREVEVLRLVASGLTNKAIAAELYLSEKTVARHLGNIFAKLDLASRAAATAYAYQHRLV